MDAQHIESTSQAGRILVIPEVGIHLTEDFILERNHEGSQKRRSKYGGFNFENLTRQTAI
jgi:hypothetical protein